MISFYMTRLRLNKTNYAVMNDLRNRYRLHNVIAAGFVGSRTETNRVLWRIDSATTTDAVILIQSAVEPDWGHLKEGYLRWHPETSMKSMTLIPGMNLRFKLVTNPVTVNGPTQTTTLIPVEERANWVIGKLAKVGFSAQIASEIKSQMLTMKKGDMTITHLESQFEGVLTITDSALAEKAILTGIGRGKAFGMGLLSLALC
jgi:CRISPR system Cascade subunit CasE